MPDEIDSLWALVVGIGTIMSAVGVMAVVEGFTRRRTVSTGASRYLGGLAGAAGGSALISATNVFGQVEASEQWVEIAASVLLSTLVLAGLAERATFLAHLAVGVVAGAVVRPAAFGASQENGLLDSIIVGDRQFFDSPSATVFSMAGWMALVGIMVIGPRRGRIGQHGVTRVIPGKSPPAAAIGAALVVASSGSWLGIIRIGWDELYTERAAGLLLAAAAGMGVGAVVSWRTNGAPSTIVIVRAVLGALVAAAGMMPVVSLGTSVVVAALGAAISLFATSRFDRARVDDPVGVVGVFGCAGVWGTIATDLGSSSQVIAQLIGALIIAAFAVVVAGVVFGLLRVARVLRLAADIEIVGLES